MSFLNEMLKSMARVLGRILIYILLGYFIFTFVNKEVNAKSYRWDFPTDINFTTNVFPNSGIHTQCTNSLFCESYQNPSNYVQYRYRISDNSLNDDTQISNGKYTIKFQATISNLEDVTLTKDRLKFSMYYYPNSNNKYAIATCDSSSNYNVIWSGGAYNVTADYTCDIFNVTSNSAHFTYFVVSIGAVGNSLVETSIASNLAFIGPGESTNDDIINNQNTNTDKITQNQDENTDKVINSITDSTPPNVNNFTYTDSTSGLVSSFLTMPLTLLRVFNNPPTCKSINLGSLYGSDLTLPCVNPKNYLGDTLWNVVDYFIIFNMITSISQLFIYVYEKFKNLDDFYNEFYTPRHEYTGYKPRHGGDS